ncbi:ABC transporter permease [Kutzneria albida]|uniref:ABC transporter, permease component n=2 Tax=Kutzneria TaxID=43356 RepID=W5WFF5_9PSEU|nr:ABC transporter permease subunit [Kutzneria albida]AHH96899.1 ABC transporter, permease component [Kutzneria albida DSM 43870]
MPSLVRKLVGLVGFLLLWEAASRSGLVSPKSVPPASEVLARFVGLFADRKFLVDVVSTVLSWAIALGCAVVLAVLLGLVLGSVPVLRAIAMPIVEFLRPLPAVALIPLVISLLGTDAQTKIVLAAFAAAWPTLMNTIYALGEVDPQLADTARSFRVGRARTFLTVTLPSISPFVLTGVRISASIALIAVVGTEFLAGGSVGLGQYAYVWGTSGGRMDVVLAAAVFAGVFGCLVNAGFSLVQRKWVSWGPEGATA